MYDCTCQLRLFSETFFPNEIVIIIKIKNLHYNPTTSENYKQSLMLALDSNIVLGLIIQYDQDVGAIAK